MILTEETIKNYPTGTLIKVRDCVVCGTALKEVGTLTWRIADTPKEGEIDPYRRVSSGFINRDENQNLVMRPFGINVPHPENPKQIAACYVFNAEAYELIEPDEKV